MHILIAGNGKMAELFETRLPVSGHTVQRFGEGGLVLGDTPQHTVALHVGSGKNLPSLVECCIKYRIPILQGSTGQTSNQEWPVLLVNAENFALPILRLIRILPEFAKMLTPPDYALSVGVTESHQSTKKTLPGTAARMAAAVGLLNSDIDSIREQSVQLALGVPPSALDGHGYHWITWEGAGVEIQLATKVNGRDAYYGGGLYLLRLLNERRGEIGVQDVISFLNW